MLRRGTDLRWTRDVAAWLEGLWAPCLTMPVMPRAAPGRVAGRSVLACTHESCGQKWGGSPDRRDRATLQWGGKPRLKSHLSKRCGDAAKPHPDRLGQLFVSRKVEVHRRELRSRCPRSHCPHAPSPKDGLCAAHTITPRSATARQDALRRPSEEVHRRPANVAWQQGDIRCTVRQNARSSDSHSQACFHESHPPRTP